MGSIPVVCSPQARFTTGYHCIAPPELFHSGLREQEQFRGLDTIRQGLFDEQTLLDRCWVVPVSLQLKITPNAKKSAFAEWIADEKGEPVLKIKLAAPPVDGKANKALVAFLAKSLGCSKSDVVIKRGEKSRSKVVEFSSFVDERDLRDRIDSMLDD